MMSDFWSFLPASPLRCLSSPGRPSTPCSNDPGDDLVAALVGDTVVPTSPNENQRYVVLEGDEKTYFNKIVGCIVTHTGNLLFLLEYPDIVENIDLILSAQPVSATKLRHYDEATTWTTRFEKWVDQVRHNVPFDTLLFWDDMKSIYTADATLTSWLDSRGLSFLIPLLEKHGCVSIDLLSYLDEGTMLSWGMKALPARVISDDIKASCGPSP